MTGDSLRCIRLEDYICRRIVGSRIHRIGTVERTRGWKTNVVNCEISDFNRHSNLTFFSKNHQKISWPPAHQQSLRPEPLQPFSTGLFAPEIDWLQPGVPSIGRVVEVPRRWHRRSSNQKLCCHQDGRL